MGVFPLILNGDNLVPSTNNNVYRYTFPTGSVFFKNSQIAVQKINMYYSWFNITEDQGNNEYQFYWYGTLTVLKTVTMPDGYYSVSDLNTYLQSYCIAEGLYLIDADGNYVYYVEFVENASRYAIEFNSYPIPTSLPAGWSQPSSWVGYPAVASTPQLVVLDNNFQNTIGFTAGTYPTVTQSTNYSALSDFTPQIEPTQSVIVTCDILNNLYSIPPTLLYSFSPTDTVFGSLIESEPTAYTFINVNDGSYNSIDITFLNQNFDPLVINDTNIVIMLLIRTLPDPF